LLAVLFAVAPARAFDPPPPQPDTRCKKQEAALSKAQALFAKADGSYRATCKPPFGQVMGAWQGLRLALEALNKCRHYTPPPFLALTPPEKVPRCEPKKVKRR
jgi:hypothetical protein